VSRVLVHGSPDQRRDDIALVQPGPVRVLDDADRLVADHEVVVSFGGVAADLARRDAPVRAVDAHSQGPNQYLPLARGGSVFLDDA
jgi:hypothetical protein